MKFLKLIVASSALLSISTFAQDLPQYYITDLGKVDGYSSYGADINDYGLVVANSLIEGGDKTQAFYVDKQGSEIINVLNNGYGKATAINKWGQVSGSLYDEDDGAFYAFITDYDGNLVLRPSDKVAGFPSDINNWGQSTGRFFPLGRGYAHTLIIEEDTQYDLGTLGGSWSEGYGINNHGQVTGRSALSENNYSLTHAFIADKNEMIDLGTLGDLNSSSVGNDINDHGQVTGFSSLAGNNESHGFIGTKEGLIDIGTLGGIYSRGKGINNHGQVVGQSLIEVGSWEYHAFLYEGNQMYDLNDIVDDLNRWAYLYDANAINYYGDIVGTGRTENGEYHAFLLTRKHSPILHFAFNDADTPSAEQVGNSTSSTYGHIESVPGIIGSAVRFDDLNDEIRIADPFKNVVHSGEMTVSFWVKMDSFPANVATEALGRSAVNREGDISFSVGPQGEVLFYLNSKHFFPDTVINEGEWTHFALTYNRIKNLVKIYQNGRAVLEGSFPEGLNVNFNTNEELRIGRGRFTSGSVFFQGAVDEFLLHDEMLTEENIYNYYNETLSISNVE